MRLIVLSLIWVVSAPSQASRSCDYFYVEMAGWFLPIPDGYYLRSLEKSDASFYMNFDDIDCHPGNPDARCERGESGFRLSYHDEIYVSGEHRWDRLDDWGGFSKYRAKRSAMEGMEFEMVMYIRNDMTLSLVGSGKFMDEYQTLLDECAWEMQQ